MKPATRILGFTVGITVMLCVLPFLGTHHDSTQSCFLHNSCLAATPVYEVYQEEEPFEQKPATVHDPLERMNRAFFKFNDKVYFWFLKPVGKVYATFIPEGLRISIRNAFDNLMMPIRAVNTLLQGKPKATGTELARFTINSTLGFAGFFDMAKSHFNIQPHDEDLGQTLGVYGMKPTFYINWPILGPSSLRDSIGLAGDAFLNPIFYLSPGYAVSAGIRAGEVTNEVSLRLGEYEDFKASALDPYIALRDAYLQHRANEIKK